MPKPRLTWRHQPDERGLAHAAQATRGLDLYYGDSLRRVQVASVRPLMPDFSRQLTGWYWYAREDSLDIARFNSAQNPVATMEEAKQEAEAYVRSCLGMVPKTKGPTP